MLNIQSTLRTAPDLHRNVSLQCYLVATVIHIQSVLSQICVCVCVYVYTYIHNIYCIEMLVGQKKIKLVQQRKLRAILDTGARVYTERHAI